MVFRIPLLAAAVASVVISTAQLANANQVPAAILVGTCFSCHGDGGKSAGAMPSINSMEARQFEMDMKAFRDGKRASTIMQRIAKGFTDDEIKVISEYLAKHAQ